jgi:hypothetical protein
MLALSACGSSGTGVLLHLQGQRTFDTISVTAHLPTGMPNQDATSGSAKMLPTDFLAILPDADVSVSFDVTARLSGALVASASTQPIAVTAHHIADVVVDLGGASTDDLGTSGFATVHGGTPPTGASLTGVWGTSASDVYFTSEAQAGVNLLHTSDHGSSFTTAGVGPGTPDLLAVSGAGGSVLLVGAQGTILRGSGSSFTIETSPAGPKTLRGVWANASNDAYAVGDGNTILHGVAGGWILQTVVGTRALQGVWGRDASHVWAVGDDGTILFSTGNGNWVAQTSGVSATLRAISGDASVIHAVGDGGVMLRSSGDGTWAAEASGTSADLYGVFARAGSVAAVGDAWTLVRGMSMVAPVDLALAGSDRLRAVWGTGASELFVAGAGGLVLHAP